MNIGPSHGNPGLNVSVNEFFHESTDLFSPPIIERDLEEVRYILISNYLVNIILYFIGG